MNIESPDPDLRRNGQILRMLQAKSLAFVGGEGVVHAVNYLKALGFGGEISVVNPKRPSVADVPAVPTVADLPFVPDAAFVAVNAKAAVASVAELAERGAGAIVCSSSGFAENGESGMELQRQLVTAAGDSVLIGPNCNGFVNYLDGTAAMIGHMGVRRSERGAALLSQGGGFLLNVALSKRFLPMSYLIGTGNSAMLGATECAQAILQDERVSAIGLYLEGNLNAARLSSLAVEALARNVPVVVLKSGRSSAGARAVLSHTASIAGEDAMVEALFKRLGLIQVATMSELVETLKIFTISGAPRGRKLGIITSSGVEAALTADVSVDVGLDVSNEFNDHTPALRESLPPIANVNNPVDLTTTYWGNTEKQAECCENFLKALEPDFSVCVATYPPPGTRPLHEYDSSVDGYGEALRRTGQRGAVLSLLAENVTQEVGERILAAGATPLQGIRDGMAAVAHAANYSLGRLRLEEQGFETIRVPGVAGRADGRPSLIDERTAKQKLSEAGIPVPAGQVVDRSGIGRDFAAKYAVKILSDTVAHKSDIGGVRLNVVGVDGVRAAIRSIEADVARHGVDVADARFLVEEMLDDAVAELLVGMRHDPTVGTAVVLGIGGVAVEVYKDSQILMLPTTRAQVADALMALKGSVLFKGFRGRPVGDLEAAIDVVMAFNNFVGRMSGSLVECEINPVIVRPQDKGAVAVDAMIVELK